MKVLFPGSFNPFTVGHKNIVDRALKLFGHVVIAIGQNSKKPANDNREERVGHIKEIYKDNPNVEVISYDGLTYTAVKENDIDFIIRGVRNQKDLEYENEITAVNYAVFGVETVYLFADDEFKNVSSTAARELNKFQV